MVGRMIRSGDGNNFQYNGLREEEELVVNVALVCQFPATSHLASP